ncbi:MAG: hypothetical protein ACQEXB_27065 [Bacillota bacterium]
MSTIYPWHQIRELLIETNWNISAVARELNINKNDPVPEDEKVSFKGAADGGMTKHPF